MDTSRSQPRFTVLLLAVFSATALALAVIGIYGVLSYSVAQRLCPCSTRDQSESSRSA